MRILAIIAYLCSADYRTHVSMQVHYLAPCPLASSASLSLYKGYYTKFVLSLVCAGPFLVPRPMASRAYLLLDEGYTQNLYFHYTLSPLSERSWVLVWLVLAI